MEYTEILAALYERWIKFTTNSNSIPCVIECEIPVGAKLYKGVDNSYGIWMCDKPELIDKSLCYCSDRIKILRWKSLHDSDWHETI